MASKLREFSTKAALFVLSCWIAVDTARAALPTDPAVREMVVRGLEYLDSHPDNRLGARCLSALAYVKAGNKSHPRIREAIQAIREEVRRIADPREAVLQEIYSTGIAVVFLCSYDQFTYRQEIRALLASLARNQKPHGGWGYGSQSTGDTSMTQYAVLANWEAAQCGISVSHKATADVAEWLMRTQDPSGAWGYQGQDPGNYGLIPQQDVRHSLAAAGLGSLYICKDILSGESLVVDVPQDLPSVVRPVGDGANSASNDRRVRVDANRIRSAQVSGGRWLAANYRIDPPDYVHYYLYALERYESIREKAQNSGLLNSRRPRWYVDGVRYLKETQKSDGSWVSECGAVPDTAFSLLFLLRSMRQSIQDIRLYGEGHLVGGRGLPKDTNNVKVEGGTVRPVYSSGTAHELLRILEDPDHPDRYFLFENFETFTSQALADAGRGTREELMDLVNSASPDARLVGVRAISEGRSLDDVPRLVNALSDPNWGVVLAANAGLKFIARKLTGFELPDRVDEQRRGEVINQWKSWYRLVRPDSHMAD